MMELIKSKFALGPSQNYIFFIIFRKRNLEREQDEIKKENTQRKQEIQTLKEVIELKKNEAEREKKYLKEALEEQEELKNQLSSDEFNLPQTLEKDIDKLKRQNDNQKRAKEKLALEITTLNEKLAQEANLYEEKGKEFEKIKLQSEEKKKKKKKKKKNENKMTHDLLAERDRTHVHVSFELCNQLHSRNK